MESGQVAATVEPPPRGDRDHTARYSGRLANGVALLAFALIGASVFWFIHRFAENIIYYDQWKDVALIQRAHDGTLTFGALWAQHNENRILFPNLVVLALAYTTHYNVIIEDYVSGALWCGATALVVVAHKWRSPRIPWIYYCPVALVLLSFLPLGDTLFGFDLTWFLAMFGLGAALFLLDRPHRTRLAMTLAVLAAVVGSFSSLQGLLIWPAGLVLLWLRGRRRAPLAAWAVSAMVTVIVYFVNFDFAVAGSGGSSVLHHPVAAVEFYLSALGNVFGLPVSRVPYAVNVDLLVLGSLVLVIALVALVRGWRSDRSGGSPIGVALIVFGLLFVLSITVGRIQLGLSNTTRYSIFTLTVWVGAYLALLAPPGEWSAEARVRRVVQLHPLFGISNARTSSAGSERPATRRPWGRWLTAGAGITLLVLLVIQVPRAVDHGFRAAENWQTSELNTIDVTANIDQAPDQLILNQLGNDSPSEVRPLADFARSQDLSLFHTPLAAEDRHEGLNPTLVVAVIRPFDGAVVSGVVALDATALFSGHSAEVEFRLTGPGRHPALVATGRQTYVGWLARWDTRTVPNGIYQLRGVLLQVGRPEYTSLPVSVDVRNGR